MEKVFRKKINKKKRKRKRDGTRESYAWIGPTRGETHAHGEGHKDEKTTLERQRLSAARMRKPRMKRRQRMMKGNRELETRYNGAHSV